MPHRVPASPKRRRRRLHACGHFVRKVKGHRYQVRWWLGGGGGSVNCGLYGDEWTAERVRAAVARETRHHPPTAMGLWRAAVAVLDRFRAEGYRVPGVLLPKYVHRHPGGGFGAKVKKGGRVLELPGPYATPEEAHLAMAGRVAAKFPLRREQGARFRRAVAEEARNHPPTDLGRWRASLVVLDRLRRRGCPVNWTVLPRHVHPREGGGYRAEATRSGRVLELPGPYATPEDAHLAMAERLAGS